MDKKSSQNRREYTESSSSLEAENASASKAAKLAFSWTKYERQREFNEEWTNLYLCIETADKKKAQCLICHQLFSQKRRSLIYHDISIVNMQNKFQKSIILDQNYELNTSVNYNLILRNKSVF